MSVMSSLLSWFLLVMAAGGGLHTNSVTAEVTIASNSAEVSAYWHTMLPNTLMPAAILELLTPPAGIIKHIGGRNTNNVQTTGRLTKDKYLEASLLKARKMGLSSTKQVEKSNLIWGPPTTDDINFFWGPPTSDDINFFWGPPTADDINFFWGPPTTDEVEKSKFTSGRPIIGESHIGQVNHKHGTMSNNVFLEEALKPGSTLTCYVLPSHTSGAPLLRRDVADTIPMSTKNFTDIMEMFAPASNVMAATIWSTLEHCEHLHAIKGETKACATSVESMVEFAALVLGVSTYNLRAFSSPDTPAEGIMPGRSYKVVAATRVTEAEDTITCHGGRFPVAVFMCHTLNPTRVYSVTLEGEDVGAGQKMELLAVCHLDTSGFDPARMPLHVNPGDAPLCHFLSRDSIVWAPATPASGHAAA